LVHGLRQDVLHFTGFVMTQGCLFVFIMPRAYSVSA
jgi:hypothetical protein